MKRRSGVGLVLVAILGLPALPAWAAFHPSPQADDSGLSSLLARGGGGGRGGGGRTGFSNTGSGLSRGDSRPQGGWSNNARGARAGGGPSLERRDGLSSGAGLNRKGLDRPVATTGNRQPLQGSGSGSRRDERSFAGTNVGDRNLGDRNLNGQLDRTRNRDVDRNWNTNVNRNWNRTLNINTNNLRPGWARPGWGYARPWNYGWYGGWSTPTWGWWGARAAAWGIGTLATAAMINEAVDNAINSQQTLIDVPNSNYQLLYGTVQPIGDSSVQFAVNVNGSTYQLTADCQSGLLNGVQPTSAAEAELLNAACQVAFGNS